MHSYEDRIRAVELYYRYGKKASVVVMELGYPSTKQLGRWVRIYEEKGDLPRELKPRERYSRTQKIAAVEHYLTHGGCLSYTRRAIGYPSNEILKRWIEEFYPNARPWSFAQAQTNASARKRGLRPSGSSVTDVEPRVKLHKA
jgi:transposase-like protein